MIMNILGKKVRPPKHREHYTVQLTYTVTTGKFRVFEGKAISRQENFVNFLDRGVSQL